MVGVERVTLGKNTESIRVNETAWLVPFVRPKNATDPTVTWTSSNPAVASVTDGQVKGLSEGSTVITATAGGKTANCKVTVSGMAASKEALQQLVDETKGMNLQEGT